MDAPINYLAFNGKNLYDEFGVYVSGSGTFGSPERDYTVVEVPGRSGDLYLDNGRFKNITVTYSSWIAEDMQYQISNLRNFLLSSKGYCRLEDSYNPDEYRLASFSGKFNPDITLLEFASFDLAFDCKPQRYLKSGEKALEYTETGTIKNPTLMTAKPLINVYGYGTFSIAGFTVTVAENEYPYVVIDSELMDCYAGAAANVNAYVTIGSDFPELPSGGSAVSIIDSTITKLEIIPRWWIL